MPYVVGKPFTAGRRRLESGEIVDDRTALAWKNFDVLVKSRFLRLAASPPAEAVSGGDVLEFEPRRKRG